MLLYIFCSFELLRNLIVNVNLFGLLFSYLQSALVLHLLLSELHFLFNFLVISLGLQILISLLKFFLFLTKEGLILRLKHIW